MTVRLELDDATVRTWDATVLGADRATGIVLDRSAFYPGGGGQPPDHGMLLWGGTQTRVVGARTGDDVYLIPHDDDPIPPVGAQVRGALDDERRTALMRTHSALHVLSGVVFRDFHAKVTGSNMEPLLARMDFNLDSVPSDFKTSVEEACNDAIRNNHVVTVRYVAADEVLALPELTRSEENLLPAGLERVRLVDIVGLDLQADSGTHVASTKQIGSVRVAKVENKGRGFRRLRLAIEP